MPAKPILLVVDTNCFIRLLFSSVRPILGSVIAGHRLVSLNDLAKECSVESEVTRRHPWLLDSTIQEELSQNCLRLREPKSSAVRQWATRMREQGNRLLREECHRRQLKATRELSWTDVCALATAQVVGGALATDEWPLRWAAERVSDVEAVFSSLGILHLMEIDKKIGRSERVATVSGWMLQGEHLPNSWRAEYLQLFGESPPPSRN